MINEFDSMMSGQLYKKVTEQLYKELMRRTHLRAIELDIPDFISRAKTSDTAKDIIRWRKISKAHVSKSIDNLRHLGYITIHEDPDDHRLIHLHTTVQAQAVLADYRSARKKLMDQLFDGISEEERRTTENVLKQMMKNMEKMISHDRKKN